VRVLLERVSQAYERYGEIMMPVQDAAGSGDGGFGNRQGNRLREVLKGVWRCEFEFCWLWKGMSWVVRWSF